MSEIKVLKFWAPWCKPCTALSTMLEGLDITNHNIDDEKASPLVEKFKIRNIPTLVFLKDGGEVHRHAGLITKTLYLEILEILNKSTSISLEETLSLEVQGKLNIE